MGGNPAMLTALNAELSKPGCNIGDFKAIQDALAKGQPSPALQVNLLMELGKLTPEQLKILVPAVDAAAKAAAPAPIVRVLPAVPTQSQRPLRREEQEERAITDAEGMEKFVRENTGHGFFHAINPFHDHHKKAVLKEIEKLESSDPQGVKDFKNIVKQKSTAEVQKELADFLKAHPQFEAAIEKVANKEKITPVYGSSEFSEANALNNSGYGQKEFLRQNGNEEQGVGAALSASATWQQPGRQTRQPGSNNLVLQSDGTYAPVPSANSPPTNAQTATVQTTQTVVVPTVPAPQWTPSGGG